MEFLQIFANVQNRKKISAFFTLLPIGARQCHKRWLSRLKCSESIINADKHRLSTGLTPAHDPGAADR